jgi:adenylate cyclase
VSSTGQQEFAFGPFRLDGHRRSLTRNGAPVSVGGRALDILLVLAEAAGATVSKTALLDKVWPGLSVEENNLQVHISALRKALGEGSIVTVPGRGYRLTAPAAGAEPAAGGVAEPAPSGPPLQDRASIAVLAFANMSSDPDQEFFSDGIANDIITELSRTRWLLVIARNSSFAYKGRNIDVKQIARELGVRYILEGSVRRSGGRVRVTAELIEVETGSHIWAERYDRDITEIFAVQDEITAAVSLAIEPAIASAEQQRAMRKPPGNLGTWEAYQRGLWHQARFDAAENVVAREFFQRAAALDPTFSPAYQGLAQTYVDDCRMFLTGDPEQTVGSAEPLARKSLALDGNDAGAHAIAGWLCLTRGDLDAGLDEADRALALGPNNASAHRLKGQCLAFSGKHYDGHQVLLNYLRLNPHDPRNWESLHVVAIACYLSADYPGAVDAARRALRANPGQPLSYRWLAAALGQIGRTNEARDVLHQAEVVVAPLAIDTYLRRRWPWQRQDDHDHMLEGLRKAGWQG